ncbi:Spy/CpxP family protein refolding chaperone [Lacisediminimonas profundi]|uniref:Spy/CpxP family protein refolding chaperone n=1 Tax=Lacisediminimonas profundi TaxID=2603856 RepID=UPI0013874894|nr:Spy/CpxP family protein refolding chaperone [Lacisediminimonas profundi]
MNKRALATLAASLFFTAAAWSQPASGPGGGGYGPGMMGGHGPGMMGGYGMGPGMMGGYGGGPWMMDGYGSGMMGGFGMGPGWMGRNIPDLTTEQRNKITEIQKDLRQKQWTLMDKMHEQPQSQNLYKDGKFDEQAARKAYDTAAAFHKQMFENSLEARKRMDGVLTAQQREKLRR